MKTDAMLKSDILDEFAWDPMVTSTDIGVIVKDGVVTLAGTLPSYAEKFAAERAAKRVAGVKALAIDLEVVLSSRHERSDSDIALAARRALEWNVLVPANRVYVMVERGHVTIDGEVDWDCERAAAERAVGHLHGVASLTNLVRILPRAQSSHVRNLIHDALARQADRQARRVDVAVNEIVVG